MAKKRVRYLLAAAGLAPAAVGVAMTPTAAHAAPGCTGHTEFDLPEVAHLVRGYGWYTRSGGGKLCIGTVVVSVYTSITGNDVPTVAVSGGISYHNHHTVAGNAGQWKHASFGVHSNGGYPVRVTATSKYFPSIGTMCAWGPVSLSCNTFG
jgi:hypothetical protein